MRTVTSCILCGCDCGKNKMDNVHNGMNMKFYERNVGFVLLGHSRALVHVCIRTEIIRGVPRSSWIHISYVYLSIVVYSILFFLQISTCTSCKEYVPFGTLTYYKHVREFYQCVLILIVQVFIINYVAVTIKIVRN